MSPEQQNHTLLGIGSWTKVSAANMRHHIEGVNAPLPPITKSPATATAQPGKETTNDKVMLRVFLNQDRKKEPWSPIHGAS